VTDDHELPGDKGQHCPRCNVNFKYQHLYDDHLPCRVADPTTAAIRHQVDERAQLRIENDRLSKALVAAYTEIETLKAGDDHMFVKGYDQAVHEIRDHFAKMDNVHIVAVIEQIWFKKGATT
jgi:hypothetical protein